MANVLIAGGTGLTGAHAALHLKSQGHEVTLMSRSAPANPVLEGFAYLQGDYVNTPPEVAALSPFDHLVFAAGADIRQLPPGEDEAAFFERANVQAIPAFFERAREAGIGSAVYIGSYYPQVVPDTIETSVYVRSRHLADEGGSSIGNRIVSRLFNQCALYSRLCRRFGIATSGGAGAFCPRSSGGFAAGCAWWWREPHYE